MHIPLCIKQNNCRSQDQCCMCGNKFAPQGIGLFFECSWRAVCITCGRQLNPELVDLFITALASVSATDDPNLTDYYEGGIVGLRVEEAECLIEEALKARVGRPERLIKLLLYIKSITRDLTGDSFLVGNLDRLLQAAFRFSSIYQKKKSEIEEHHYADYITAIERGDYDNARDEYDEVPF